MSLIITFMFEPAKLQMNCARARGMSIVLREGVGSVDLVASATVTTSLRCPAVRTLGFTLGSRRRTFHVMSARRPDQGATEARLLAPPIPNPLKRRPRHADES